MSDVRLKNARKSFKDMVAVDDLSRVRERRLR
jgi:hypothetical protein